MSDANDIAPTRRRNLTVSYGAWSERTSSHSLVTDGQWTEVQPRSAADRLQRASVPPSCAGLDIGDVLAEGGLGEVREAVQVELGRGVAVKTARGGNWQTLVAEARIASLVEHPNVVPLYALERTPEGQPLMVMKRIHGDCWRDVIRNDSHPMVAHLSPPDRLEWHLRVLMSVCDAMEFAHSRRLLHLDLKPSNVMLGKFREVYVADWGAAASLDERHRGWLPMADELRLVMGTPAYIAPEMITDAAAVDERTDVYLLGAILAEILNQTPPHGGRSEDEAYEASVAGNIPQFRADAPRELVLITTRALQRRPADRFATVLAFRAAVADFIRHRESIAIARDAAMTLSQVERLVEERFGAGSDHELIPPVVHRQIQQLLGQCQFGFKRALATWPANPGAIAGADALCLVAARYYFATHSFGLVEASLATLRKDPTPSVRAAADEIRAAVVVARKERGRTQRLVEQHDPRPGSTARAWLFVAVSTAWFVSHVAGFFLLQRGLYQWRPWHMFVELSAVMTMVLGAGYLFRRQVMPNAKAKRTISAAVLICCSVMYYHALSLGLGHFSFQEVALRCAEFGGAVALGGVLVDRRYFAIATPLLIAAPLAAVWPEYGLLTIAAMASVGTEYARRMWSHAARKATK